MQHIAVVIVEDKQCLIHLDVSIAHSMLCFEQMEKNTHQGDVAPLIALEPKRGPGRPRKHPVSTEPAVRRGPGRPRKDGTPAQARQPKQRGDRRAKFEKRGRRKLDLNKIQLDDFSEHLVVYRKDGALTQQTFKSRDRAEQLVRELLNAGHVATEIAYYKLNPIKTTVTVTI